MGAPLRNPASRTHLREGKSACFRKRDEMKEVVDQLKPQKSSEEKAK